MIDLTQQAFLLDLKVGQLTLSRKVASTAVETDANPELLKISKKILGCPEMQTIKNHLRNVRTMIDSLKIPTGEFVFRHGMYLMPYSLLDVIETRISEAEKRLSILVEEFLEVYEKAIAADRESLKSLFSENDYPDDTKIRDAFKLTYSYQMVATPDALKTYRFDIYKREAQKMQTMMEAAAEQSRGALIQQALELAKSMVEKLTPGEDGKPKTIKENVFGNWNNYLEFFSDKNISGDADLEALMKEIKHRINGVNSQTLRSDTQTAAEIKTLFEGVMSNLSSHVTDRPVRKMSLEDEPAQEAS